MSSLAVYVVQEEAPGHEGEVTRAVLPPVILSVVVLGIIGTLLALL